jgi:hypothetical protein
MCSVEELEALVEDKLDDEATARVTAHVASCEACRDDLAWLRTEAELMARRRQQQPELAPALWQSIAERVAQPAAVATNVVPLKAKRWGLGARVAYGGLLAAAAAAVVVATWPGQGVHVLPSDLRDAGLSTTTTAAKLDAHRSGKKLAPDVALDNAEKEYRDAAGLLEAEYKEERGRLPPSVAERYDRMLAETRARVADARVVAGNDVDGRMVVLDGYAEYLRSLQTIVTDIR